MFEVHIETWMMDADTANWLAGETWWLDSQYYDARNIAKQQGNTVDPQAAVTLTGFTQTGAAPDGGLLYDFVYEVDVTE